MAIPSLRVIGAKANSGNATAVAPNASHVAGDIEILVVETAGNAATLSTAAGFAAITGGAQAVGTAEGADGTRMTTFWRRWNGTDGNPTVADSGDHQFAYILSFQNCIAAGTPYHAVSGNTQTATTAGSVSATTTTIPGTLIVMACAGSLPDQVSGAEISAGPTNASLGSLTKQIDETTNSGNGGWLGVITGTRAATGSTGATTFTKTTSCTMAHVIFGLLGAQSGSFTADAILRAGSGTKTFATNALVRKVQGPITFTTDAILAGPPIEGSFTASAVLLKTTSVAGTSGSVTKTFTWAEDAEGFVQLEADGAWSPTGNPAGSGYAHHSSATQGDGEGRFSLGTTWTDVGVPVGSTPTNIRVASFDAACTQVGPDCDTTVVLRPTESGVPLIETQIPANDGVWTSYGAGPWFGGPPTGSTLYIELWAGAAFNASSGESESTIYVDNLAIEIPYSGGGVPVDATIAEIAASTVEGSLTADAIAKRSSGTQNFATDAIVLCTSSTKTFTVSAIVTVTITGSTWETFVGGASFTLGNLGTYTGLAESFSVTDSWLASFSYRLWRTVGVTDNVVVEIQTDSGGLPSGTVIATIETITGSTLSTSRPASPRIVFLSLYLAAGTYWLVWRRTGTLAAAYYLLDGATTSAYANGRLAANPSDVWALGLEANDIWFDARSTLFTAGAILRKIVNPTVTVDAIRRAPFVATFSANAVLLKTQATHFGTAITVTESGVNLGRTTGTQRTGQSFIPQIAGTLTRLKYGVARLGTLADSLVVELQSDDANKPSGNVLTTLETVVGTTLPVNVAARTVFPSIAVNTGTRYWIVSSRSGAADDNNYYLIANPVSSNYGEGSRSTFTTSWTTSASVDLYFEVEIGGLLVDAFIQRVNTATFTTSAIVQAAPAAVCTVDAVVFATIGASDTANAIIQASQSASLAADALIVQLVWQDTFSRTATGGWGTPDIGIAYSPSNVSGVSVGDGVGYASTNVNLWGIPGAWAGLIQFDFYVGTLDQTWYWTILATNRWLGVDFSVDDGWFISSASLAGAASILSIPASVGEWWRVKGWAAPNDFARLKVWKVGSAEPDWAQSEATGSGGSRIESAVEPRPGGTTIQIDNIYVWAAGPPTWTMGGFSADAQLIKTQSASLAADAVLLAGRSASASADAILRLPCAGSVTADAILFATIAPTATVDALVVRGGSGTLSADATIFGTQTGSLAGDAVVRRSASREVSADAVTRGEVAASLTTDAIVRRTEPGSLTVAAIVEGPTAGTLSADAVVRLTAGGTALTRAVLLKPIQASLTTDAIVGQSATASASADAVICIPVSTSVDAFAIVEASQAATIFADGIITVAVAAMVVADSVIRAASSETLRIDAVICRTTDGGVSVSAYVILPHAGSATVDATIFGTQTGSAFADAWIGGASVGFFSVDATIYGSISVSVSADSVIVRPASSTATADAFILRSASGAFSASAIIGRAAEGTASVDAYLLLPYAGSATADATIFRTISGSWSTDAWISAAGIALFLADAVISRTQAHEYAADSIQQRTFSATFTADAVLSAQQTAAFSADAVTLQTLSATASADAVVRQTRTVGSSVDAVLLSPLGNQISAAAVLRRPETGATNADALIARPVAGSYDAAAITQATFSFAATVDAFVLGGHGGVVTCDAIIGQSASVAVSADAVIEQSVHGELYVDASVRVVHVGSFAVDAVILAFPNETWKADSVIRVANSADFVASAYLQTAKAAQFEANAVISRVSSATFTAAATCLRGQTGSCAVDAAITISPTAAFSVDALLVRIVTAAFSAAAVIRYNVFTITADAVVEAIATQRTTVDAVITIIRPPFAAAIGATTIESALGGRVIRASTSIDSITATTSARTFSAVTTARTLEVA